MAEEKQNEDLTQIEENLLDNDPLSNDTSSDNQLNNSESIIPPLKEKKQKSLVSKILIYVIIFLIVLIAVGIILYMTGFFTPEEKVEEVKDSKQQVIENKIEEKPKYEFSLSDINSKKLNDQLLELTNKNINQEKLEEKEKIENEKKLVEEQNKKREEELQAQQDELNKEKNELEARKLELEQQKAELENLKQEAITLKEAMENSKKQLEEEVQKEDEIINIPVVSQNNMDTQNSKETMNEEENKNNQFLLLINVAKIKGNLYKSYLDKISKINPDVKLCRDDKNRIEIYFGPFKTEEERDTLLEKLIENKFKESYSVELTTDEFNKRCNY